MKVAEGTPSAPTDQQTAPIMDFANVNTSMDDSGIYCVKSASSGVSPGPLYDNALLEALGEFRSQATRFTDTITRAETIDRSLQESYYAAMAPIFEHVSPEDASSLISRWGSVDAESFDLKGATKAKVDSTLDIMNDIEMQAALSQQQIVSIGTALVLRSSMNQGQCAEATKGVLAEIDGLTASRDGVKNNYDQALTAFENASANYKTFYGKARIASNELEDARF
jgi:hypothetical protein